MDDIYHQKYLKYKNKYLSLKSQAGGMNKDKTVYKNMMMIEVPGYVYGHSDVERIVKLKYSKSEQLFYITYAKFSDDYGNERELGKIYPMKFTKKTDTFDTLTIMSEQKNTKPLILVQEGAKSETDHWGAPTQRLQEWINIMGHVVAHNGERTEYPKSLKIETMQLSNLYEAVISAANKGNYKDFGTPTEKEIQDCRENRSDINTCFNEIASITAVSPSRSRSKKERKKYLGKNKKEQLRVQNKIIHTKIGS